MHILDFINVSLILVPQKYWFYYLDQEYCLKPYQFVKYWSYKISAGFRFCACVLRVESHKVRGWKLKGWVDVPCNFHDLRGSLLNAIDHKNFKKCNLTHPIIKHGRVFQKIYLMVHCQVWDNFLQLNALQKLLKMLFIPPKKLLLISRYLSFDLTFWSCNKTAW